MLNSTIEVVGGTVVFKVLGGVESTLQETDGRDVLISEPHHQQTQQHCQDSRWTGEKLNTRHRDSLSDPRVGSGAP